MKNINIKIALLVLVAMLFSAINAVAQVGIGTTMPNESSMLDIQSTAKGVLIPRMLTSERDAISSPANGLLVFDTQTKSFWYYNVVTWKELVSGSLLVDVDGDTKVEVEKTTDLDEINFTTSGTERMKIDANGVIIMGDSIHGNYTKVTTDGSLSYSGNATRWEDLRVPVNTVKTGSSWWNGTTESASWESFLGGTQLIWFPGNTDDNAVYFTAQMPHGWKEGSAIMPHVHWTNKSAPGNSRVTWLLEYTWANPGEAFSTPTKISGSVVETNSGNILEYEHAITPLGTAAGIIATGKTLSSMLICKLSRKASDGSDDFSGAAGLLEIDFHYQVDSDGSNEEYKKW